MKSGAGRCLPVIHKRRKPPATVLGTHPFHRYQHLGVSVMKTIWKRGLCACLLCCLLLLSLPALAYGIKVQWVPSRHQDAELNTKDFCTLQTEYPVYRPGVKSIQVVLTNHTRYMLMYGTSFDLERWEEDGWYTCEQKEEANTRVYVAFTAIGLPFPPKSTQSISADPDHWGLGLPEGRYRIVKDVRFDDPAKKGEGYFSAEFLVAEDGHDDTKLSGYTPLKQLPAAYSLEQALADHAYYIDEAGNVQNASAMKSFLQKLQQHTPAKVRIAQRERGGALLLTDISYGAGISRFVVEQDHSRSKSTGAVPFSQSYYSMLQTERVDGKTALRLTNTLHKTHKYAKKHTLVADIRLVGSSLSRAVAKELSDQPGYTIYTPARWGTRSFGYGAYLEEIQFGWNRQAAPGTIELATAQITDAAGLADKLLSMQFVDESQVKLVFSRKDQKEWNYEVTCEIWFNLDRGEIEDTTYTVHVAC